MREREASVSSTRRTEITDSGHEGLPGMDLNHLNASLEGRGGRARASLDKTLSRQ